MLGRAYGLYTTYSWLKTTLLKSDVTRRDNVIRWHGSQECGSRFVNFIRDGTVFT